MFACVETKQGTVSLSLSDLEFLQCNSLKTHYSGYDSIHVFYIYPFYYSLYVHEKILMNPFCNNLISVLYRVQCSQKRPKIKNLQDLFCELVGQVRLKFSLIILHNPSFQTLLLLTD